MLAFTDTLLNNNVSPIEIKYGCLYVGPICKNRIL